MHKIFAVALTMAMVFSVANGAKAWYWPSNDIKIENEHTNVLTTAKADVDTGSVYQMGGHFVTATTGDVYSVGAVALSQVNMTNLGGCACSRMGDVKVENERTNVMTTAVADVSTGKVSQFSWSGMKMAKTGSVAVVGTEATSVVNYTDFSVTEPTNPTN